MNGSRYPIGPLLEILTDRGITGERQVAETLDISRRRLRTHQTDGIPWADADEYAIRIGYLPFEVWPEWNHAVPQCRRCTDDYDCPEHVDPELARTTLRAS